MSTEVSYDWYFYKTNDSWRMKTYVGLEESIYLKSIDITLKMADIYQKVDNLKNPQAVLDFNGEEEWSKNIYLWNQ